MINKTKGTSGRISVLLSCCNDAQKLPPFLATLGDQKRPPEQIVVLDRGSTDRSPVILKQWNNRLNVTLIRDNMRPGGKTLNFLTEKTGCEYVIPLKLNSRLEKNYLQLLAERLQEQPSISAAGGQVSSPENITAFQQAAHSSRDHLPKSFNFIKDEERAAGFLYRKKTIIEAGGWRDNLIHGAQTELIARLKNQGKKVITTSETSLFYLPSSSWRNFYKMQQTYGHELGELAGRDLLPSLKYWRADRFFTVWSFVLAWNPVGWSLILVYLGFVIPAGIYRTLKNKPEWRRLYLLPLLHLGLWLGWLNSRFKNTTD